MPGKNEFEYIVIGLGGIGTAAAYWLARKAGQEVLGLEQFELGHDKGASEDHSRIIRLSYHTPEYVALAQHAYAAWRELEAESGEVLLVITGDLFLGPRESPMPVTDYIDSLAAQNVPFERLDADEIMRRWPQFRLDEDVIGTFQEQGGLVAARKGVLAHARMARAHGATLRDHASVLRITPLPDGAEVVTPDETYRCRRVVMATDAWTNPLLQSLGMSLPLTLMEEQVSYFATPHLEEFKPESFPVWVWSDEPNFYGIPLYGEERGVKAAQDMAGRQVTLATRTYEPDPETLRRVSAFLQRTIPRAYGPILYSKTCIYTLTPDRDFVIDTLPHFPQISLALGAGHGYKFACLIGCILSDLAIGGATEYDIARFAVDRPLLKMADPPRDFILRRTEQPGEAGDIDAVTGGPRIAITATDYRSW